MPSRPESAVRRAARLALALVFAVAGVAHLVVTEAMVRITPGWVPWPRAVVIATGLCELLGASGLLTRRWRVPAGWALAAYALCVWPANMKHAMLDLGSGHGLGWGYHAPRLLAQPLIIWWCLWASGAWPGRRRR